MTATDEYEVGNRVRLETRHGLDWFEGTVTDVTGEYVTVDVTHALRFVVKIPTEFGTRLERITDA